jgi:hypothetical protein
MYDGTASFLDFENENTSTYDIAILYRVAARRPKIAFEIKA